MKQISLFLIIPLLLLGCTGTDDGSVTITGSAGGLTSRALAKSGMPILASQVGIFKVVDNSVSVDTVLDAEYVPIDSSGDFEISLTKETDTNYILMLFGDDIYDIENQYFLSFLINSEDSLVSLNIENAESVIDIGELMASDTEGELNSELSVSEVVDSFGLDSETIYRQARLDDNVMNIINYLNNYDVDTEELYTPQYASLMNHDFSKIENQFSTPGVYLDIVRQLNIYISNPDGHSYQDYVDGDLTIEVYPSEALIFQVGVTSYAFGPDSPFSTETYSGNIDDWFGDYGFSFSLNSDVPSLWTIKNNGVTKARIKAGFFDGFTSDGNYKFIYPSVKATVDSDNIVTKLELRYYYFNYTTRQYELVTDLDLIDEFGGISVSYTLLLPDPDNPENNIFRQEDISSDSLVINNFSEDWVFPETAAGYAFMSVNTGVGEMPYNFYYSRIF